MKYGYTPDRCQPGISEPRGKYKIVHYPLNKKSRLCADIFLATKLGDGVLNLL